MLDKAVFDTNIILSKIISQQLHSFIELLIRHSVEAYTCEEQLEEVEVNLSEKRLRKFLTEKPGYYSDFLREYFICRKIEKRFDRGPLEDAFLVDLAYTVKSNYLITGDHALRLLKHVGEIQIVSYSQWLRLLQQQ